MQRVLGVLDHQKWNGLSQADKLLRSLKEFWALQEIRENDLVALLVDLPPQGLRRGDVGTMVELFTRDEHHPSGYIVEFVTESGAVYAQAEITDPSQIIPLRLKLEAA